MAPRRRLRQGTVGPQQPRRSSPRLGADTAAAREETLNAQLADNVNDRTADPVAQQPAQQTTTERREDSVNDRTMDPVVQQPLSTAVLQQDRQASAVIDDDAVIEEMVVDPHIYVRNANGHPRPSAAGDNFSFSRRSSRSSWGQDPAWRITGPAPVRTLDDRQAPQSRQAEQERWTQEIQTAVLNNVETALASKLTALIDAKIAAITPQPSTQAPAPPAPAPSPTVPPASTYRATSRATCRAIPFVHASRQNCRSPHSATTRQNEPQLQHLPQQDKVTGHGGGHVGRRRHWADGTAWPPATASPGNGGIRTSAETGPVGGPQGAPATHGGRGRYGLVVPLDADPPKQLQNHRSARASRLFAHPHR